MALDDTSDPLTILPPEIVLRILEFTSISSVAALTCLTKAWHTFIDETHQDAIYSSSTKIIRTHDIKSPADYASNITSFAHYFSDVKTWKELCQKQTLLDRNWRHERPTTTESVLQIGNDPVWRFRPDFKRRIILSTSQGGGLNVTCMNTGRRLWSLSHADVRPYAHLEYSEIDGRGVAVFDRLGNSLEVWRSAHPTATSDGQERGVFEKVAVLHHDCETRGYQLSYGTLCVVSTQGQGFVYDMSVCARDEPTTPPLITHLEIANDAVGHLDQSEDCVMFSLGRQGYHVHDKFTGRLLMAIEPWKCSSNKVFHVAHPRPQESGLGTLTRTVPSLLGMERHGPTRKVWPPQDPSTQRLTPIIVEKGPVLETPSRPAGARSVIEEDEWGAGMFSHDMMVGVSRGGRVVIVRNWRQCLPNDNNSDSSPERVQQALQDNTSLVLCRPHEDTSNFDLGGWLSVHHGRIMFEVCERIYVLAVHEDGQLHMASHDSPTGQYGKSSFACSTSSAPELAVPVSFMALFDDCLMHTYTTLGFRQTADGEDNGEDDGGGGGGGRRIFPTKAIRVLSLAPTLDTPRPSGMIVADDDDEDERQRAVGRAGLMGLIGLLGGDLEHDEF